ncbi:glycosyltransferase family 2 protein [Sulfuriroseicoccus oceanibius]|uniref:Glycosyltransferase n=1 Tax=Sulfuriroseicoccus oceanibius TaxID=2707525 RepID=A0A7T7EZL7_9BACT|nr:cellulose synthase catalytic subunit [Sulfuriroseicoccus oceanibius]QQL44106.1 glycosyltransferase [Sulfuriroseicoccus oceanibius]
MEKRAPDVITSMFSDFPGLLSNLLLFVGLFLLVRNLDPQKGWLRFALAGLAIFLNVRYFNWRLGTTMDPFLSSAESVWQWGFFVAELVALCSLSWHLIVFIQRPRKPEEKGYRRLDPDGDCPSVDVFIATYNEELEILRPTILGASAINYPNVNVYVLDDGERGWLEELCADAGVHYVTRQDRSGFKSGNLNNALKQAKGDFIMCLDADFVVDPDILLETLGYFDDDAVGIVQTPQHFDNPDAIQLNLNGGQSWPEEQRIFTDVMQPCRDNWDNAFCYGTNFVVRRECIDRIGGFPVESICEDLLLTYKLKEHGWITRFHLAPLALGKAADTLSTFITQRVRWCTGTLQCLFLKSGPIRSRGLSLLDRVFFFDTMGYYLSSIWFFFVLIAPAVFWWTGRAPFDSDNGHLLMMFAPRVLVSTLVLYWLTERKVMPVISELGRFVSVFHILRAIFVTLINPRGGVFKVTDKNLSRDRATINWQVATPHLVLLAVTLGGMAKTFLFGLPATNFANENLGLILALTTFYLWMTFLALLACVEPPFAADGSRSSLPATTGSFRKSFFSLARKVAQ